MDWRIIMPRSHQQPRRGAIIVALCVVSIFTWFFSHQRLDVSVSATSHGEFWRHFYQLLSVTAPDCDSPERIANAETVGFDPANNTAPLSNLLRMPEADVQKMLRAHAEFLSAIQSDPPALHYKPGTHGLVSTAGGPYLPVLVVSLRMLRRTGSKLPMEVFLADWTEYDGYTCTVVLPSLNARCVVLADILDAAPGSAKKIARYQFKILAMLFSSFEEIFFLDADAFPLHPPEKVFFSEPFRSRGLITWPDFWRSTASPLFYMISGLEAPPPNLRQSTESGELFISKRKHLRTLLLSAYYNFWGPSHYYRLLSQGAPGEGDKETFIAAAMVVREPFYQVSEPLRALGRHENGEFFGSAMIQFDPTEDFVLTSSGEWRIRGSTASSPRPYVIHANFPKFNPATILAEPGPAITKEEAYTRAWAVPPELSEAFGTDLERHFWMEIRWTACALEGKTLSWQGKEGICNKVKEYYRAVFNDV